MATDVETRLTYLHWQPSYNQTRPYRIGQFAGRRRLNKQREKKTNLAFCVADHAETIRDVRGLIEDTPFNLDTNGFSYRRCPRPALTMAYDYSDPEKIKNIFLPECETILKREVEGADEVMIFDWKVGNNNNLTLSLVAEVSILIDQKEKKCKGATKEKPKFAGFCPAGSYW